MSYSVKQIKALVEANKKVRITRQDTMSFGKFVALQDHEDLLKKNYVRFVSGANLDSFEGTSLTDPEQRMKGSLNLTKVYDIRTILLLEQF